MTEKNKATTYEEFLTLHEAELIATTTSSGMTFEIRRLDPGDFVALVGSPFVRQLVAESEEESPLDAAVQALADTDLEEALKLVSDDSFMEIVKDTVCGGTASINFINKDKDVCDITKKEVSIGMMPLTDLFEVFAAIIGLSHPQDEVEEVRLFRGEGEGVTSGDDTDIPDSEDVQPETVPDTVSSSVES